MRSDAAPAASLPSAVKNASRAPSAGSARAATPPPPAGLLERVVQLDDGAAVERLVQAAVLDPLDVADDGDAGHHVLLLPRALAVKREHRQERLLRHLDRADDLHALLALLLLLEQLALARDVAAVALRRARPCAWP